VEQLSFMEFSQCLPSPGCLVSLAMKPYEGNAVLEINNTLVFPILEMLLGGSGKFASKMNREITEIEQSILDGLYRIILHDLHSAWQAVATLDFTIESHETEPQLLQILAPNEAVVAVSLEVRIGDNSGMMNLGVPSIVIKMLRQKFDQQWSVRKTESTTAERDRILRLIRPAAMLVDARLQGPTLAFSDVMEIEAGDILTFDYPVDKPVDLLVNSRLKYHGHVATDGRKRAFRVEELYNPLK
jgi:flagellar motor switch protein FliM